MLYIRETHYVNAFLHLMIINYYDIVNVLNLAVYSF